MKFFYRGFGGSSTNTLYAILVMLPVMVRHICEYIWTKVIGKTGIVNYLH